MIYLIANYLQGERIALVICLKSNKKYFYPIDMIMK